MVKYKSADMCVGRPNYEILWYTGVEKNWMACDCVDVRVKIYTVSKKNFPPLNSL